MNLSDHTFLQRLFCSPLGFLRYSYLMLLLEPPPNNYLVKNLMAKICTFEKLYLTLRPLSNLWRGTCMLLR